MPRSKAFSMRLFMASALSVLTHAEHGLTAFQLPVSIRKDLDLYSMVCPKRTSEIAQKRCGPAIFCSSILGGGRRTTPSKQFAGTASATAVAEIKKSSTIERPMKRQRVTKKVEEKGAYTSSGSGGDDSIRWYLHTIGQRKLLRAEDEIKLAQEIRIMLRWEDIKDKLTEEKGLVPTEEEWANALDIDVPHLRYQLRRSQRAKDHMVSANLRLVVSIAKKYLNHGLNLQDLIQEGSLGLIRATEKFDPDKGFKFSTYATWWIRQSITRAIADHSRVIRLPVHMHDLLNTIKKHQRDFELKHNRPASEEELAESLDIPVAKLRLAQQNKQTALSLDMKVGGHGHKSDAEDMTLSKILKSEEPEPSVFLEGSMLRQDIETLMGQTLSPRERDVVRMRYGLEDGKTRTLEEIGTMLSVTRERVRQIEAKALRKLRQPSYCNVLKEYVEDSI